MTDRGSCFTADDFERACAKLKVARRLTKPYTPQTNGPVECFNGRVASEVLGTNVAGHADLETLLIGFNLAYNRRRQRVLSELSPIDKAAQRLELNARLANTLYKTANNKDIMAAICDILYFTNKVS